MNWIGLLRINVIGIILFISCTESYKILKEESREPYASLRFSNFKRIEYKGIGLKKWEILAEEAYLYQEDKTNELQKIIVYKFTFQQYLPKPSTLIADKANIDYLGEKMKLEGNAEYQDEEMMLKSQYLEYDLKSDILDTKQNVWIKRKGTELECLNGFYYNKMNGLQICRKPSGKYLHRDKKKEQNKQNDFFF